VYVCCKEISDTVLAFNLVQTLLHKLQPTYRPAVALETKFVSISGIRVVRNS